MAVVVAPTLAERLIAAGGETGALIAAFDWSSTSLGPIETWPQSLKTAVDLMLGAKQPVYVAWGPQLISLYNDGYLAIVGTKHPGVGLPFAELWTEIWDEFRPIVEATMAGEAQHFVDMPIALAGRPGVPVGYFTFSYTPLRDDTGAIAGFYCAATETTANVLVERQRVAERERLAQMFEQAPGIIALLEGPEHVFALANAAYRELIGNRDVLGKPVRTALPEVEGQGFFELLDRVYATGKPHRGEAAAVRLMRSSTGQVEERFVDFVYQPITDAAGSVTGIFVEGSDVTERTRTEERLRESEARLRAAVLASPFPIMLHAEDGEVLELSRKWTALAGYTREDIRTHHDWARLAYPDGTVAFDEQIAKEFASDSEVAAGEWKVRAKDGSTRVWDFYNVGVGRLPDGRKLQISAAADVTERKRVEDALRSSEERYRTLFEAIDAGFCVVEVLFDKAERPIDYRFVEANPAFERQTGLVNALGRTARELVQNLEPHWFEIYGRVALTGEPVRFENGSEAMGRWFDVHALRIGNPDARRVALLFNDISERRRAELALRELNETLERRIAEALAERKVLADLVEGTDAFVQVADPDFRWLAINMAAVNEFERIFGVRPKVGDSMLDALAHLPEHQTAVRDVWSRALAGEAFTEVGEFGDPGRERRCYEMKYNVLRGASGELIGAYQFVYDVTERVREQRRLTEAEAARREADALYRAYFENTPEALFVIGVEPDSVFVVEQINPAHEAGVGFELEEVRGKRIEDILPPEIAQRVLATYRHVVETGELYQYREVFDLNGEPQHWDTSLVPVRDADGRITRLIGSSRNVTRQVIAEEALRQSQKMEAMGQLTGGVAHDFNNLLTPIVGSLDMLQRRGIGGEREQRLIAGAAQSAERAKTLVQRLLAFARRQPLQAVPVDVAKLVTGMAELVASTTGPQIKVVVEAPEDLPAAKADPNQLEMALLNLAVNARDAMPEGGTLRISASAERVGAGYGTNLRPGAYVRLSVADTGSGMDEATLARAVEPFFSTKGVGKGTGLGLSMVHGLASQLGGALTIRSKPGLGTNIELWLPQSASAPEAVEAPSEAPPEIEARGRALLVDDEELVRMSTADMLADLGYAVVEAASGEEAIRLIDKGERFDLLVTDHLMPGMTGTDLARAVRSIRPDVPVLVVSGYAENEGIAPDLPRLTKPFRKDELASSLAQLSGSA